MAYVYILENKSGSNSVWQPKYAHLVKADPFNITTWRSKYWTANTKPKRNAVAANFEKAYVAWLQNLARKKLNRNTAVMSGRANLIAAKRAEKLARTRVARRPATARRPNQIAAAQHAGSTRSASPRRRIVTAGLPANAAALARANARLTEELQNVVNALKANLRKRGNARLRSPRGGNSR